MKKVNLDIKKEGKKVKGFFNDFKSFIKRGNVMDLAVGVVIGTAFGKIVTSLVNDIIMPLVGLLIGGQDFKNLSIKINNSTIAYGSFIQNIVDFLIISFFVFVFIRLLNNLFKKKEIEDKKAENKAPDIILLEEIRDILKKQS